MHTPGWFSDLYSIWKHCLSNHKLIPPVGVALVSDPLLLLSPGMSPQILQSGAICQECVGPSMGLLWELCKACRLSQWDAQYLHQALYSIDGGPGPWWWYCGVLCHRSWEPSAKGSYCSEPVRETETDGEREGCVSVEINISSADLVKVGAGALSPGKRWHSRGTLGHFLLALKGNIRSFSNVSIIVQIVSEMSRKPPAWMLWSLSLLYRETVPRCPRESSQELRAPVVSSWVFIACHSKEWLPMFSPSPCQLTVDWWLTSRCTLQWLSGGYCWK